MFTAIDSEFSVLNPAWEAVSKYWPAVRLPNSKCPAWSVVISRLWFCESSSVICTPGTTAPEGSDTVPAKPPRCANCATACGDNARSSRAKPKTRTLIKAANENGFLVGLNLQTLKNEV